MLLGSDHVVKVSATYDTFKEAENHIKKGLKYFPSICTGYLIHEIYLPKT